MKKQWWHDKIAYQIYPKSFNDSNGDGIGDVRGIIQKLDYLKDLGVDIIWLSPIYKTPFADQGYDISDYYDIDPAFGSMEDMEELLEEARKRDMYILMDLVVNHCSDEHEWFKKACEDPDGKYGKYFIIKDSDKEPNNWRSYFGGNVWEKLPGHEGKYYFHAFHKKQPDLNWENPEVVEEIYKNINWWLDKGLKGFRIDAIVNIKKDLTFADLPVDGIDGLGECTKMLPKAEGLIEALQELKENTFAKYDAFTVAELFNYDSSKLAEYIGDEGCFSTIFDFSTDLVGKAEGWHNNKKPTSKEIREAIFDATDLAEGVGYMCSVIENHDEPRGVSRYLPKGADSDEAKKALATIFVLRKGLPFIYQGQEIGMSNCVWNSVEEFDDISTLDQYDLAIREGLSPDEALKAVSEYSRDNARTPMHWTGGENAGFTTGKPWLKMNPNYVDINVESQLADENSMHSYYKELIALRKSPEYKDTFVYGQMVPVYDEHDDVFAFYRKGEANKTLVISNLGSSEVKIPLHKEELKLLINNQKELVIKDEVLTLKPYQALVFEVK